MIAFLYSRLRTNCVFVSSLKADNFKEDISLISLLLKENIRINEEQMRINKDIHNLLTEFRENMIIEESAPTPEYISVEACTQKLTMSQRQVKSICRDLNIPVLPMSARVSVVNYQRIQEELHKINNKFLEDEIIDTGALDIGIPDNESKKLEDESQKNELSQK